MQGDLHPSLKAYIDCFTGSPFPKMFPRGGGIWDQDPILMRDFRHIRKFEREWRETQDKMREAGEHLNRATGANPSEGGGPGLSGALDQYIEHLKEEGEAF